MKRLATVGYSACLWSVGLLPAAEVRLTPKTVVCFATLEEARDLLGTRDEFVRRMSPFDRAARMNSDRPVSEKEFLEWVARSALPWEAKQKDQIVRAISAVSPELNRLRLDFPEKVLMIKSAVGDAGAAHTRINAVILPETMVSESRGIREELLAHELLHILTRHDPKLRRSLYAVIGFRSCNEIELPQALKARKITNPDAPWNDAYITVSLDGQPISVVPLLFSQEEKYDRQKGRGLFGYLTFRLLAIEQAGGQWKPKYRDGKPILLEVGQVSDFHEQVGRNTAYTIHPEEIIADNFALLVTGKQNVPSPEILRKLREVLSKTQPQAAETSQRGPSTPPG
jgi:hypothetical protein